MTPEQTVLESAAQQMQAIEEAREEGQQVVGEVVAAAEHVAETAAVVAATSAVHEAIEEISEDILWSRIDLRMQTLESNTMSSIQSAALTIMERIEALSAMIAPALQPPTITVLPQPQSAEAGNLKTPPAAEPPEVPGGKSERRWL